VDGFYFAGLAANMMGEYARAEAPLKRVLQLDSLGFRSPSGGRCRVCEAYSGLGYAYGATDSMRKLGALAHEFVRRHPTEAQAWRVLASLHAQEYKPDSAIAALQVADSLEPTNPWNRRYLISVRAVAEQYDEAERLLRTEVEAAPLGYRVQARWDLAVVLRQTGRLREALSLARSYRAAIRERYPPGSAPYNALHEGQILFELGQYAAAAALFDSIARGQATEADPSLRARDQGWAWVHEADARAALGDTARLRFLADTMEILGRSVAHARDRRLHAHVRGLLARVQGHDEEAVRWFRAAIVSPVLGFTRSNYEEAGALMRLGRPAEAIGPLRSALHGGTDGSTLYITRTELQARMAQAFDAAGETDSARYYYGKVLRLWEHADPQFAARRDTMRIALERIGGS
jgi:tetratricopeptide (TPR) repeat protein